ncbi:MAG: hypothetical protein OXC95_00190 [Dehalococcoidia bacterium]|nr:hypothetical protein [Dehalococcoidia bacterium]
MATRTQHKREQIREPLADGEYTDAPNAFTSVWRITPEQKEWVEKYNEAIGILNTTGDRTMVEELGISLSEE